MEHYAKFPIHFPLSQVWTHIFNTIQIKNMLSSLCYVFNFKMLIIRIFTYRSRKNILESYILKWSDIRPISAVLLEVPQTRHQYEQGVVAGISINITSFNGIASGVSYNDVLTAMRSLLAVNYDNIFKFVGIVLEPSHACVIFQGSYKENVYDFLKTLEIDLTQNFRISLLLDVADGVRYLHHCGIVHGNLSTKSIYLSSTWEVKISDYWIGMLSCSTQNVATSSLSDEVADNLLWTAPEILQGKLPSKQADVFSFGIIVFEMISCQTPYSTNLPVLSSSAIVLKVADSSSEYSYRPYIEASNMLAPWKKLAEVCWDDDPESRLQITDVMKALRKMNNNHEHSIVDSLISRMQELTVHLEDIVEVPGVTKLSVRVSQKNCHISSHGSVSCCIFEKC